MGRRKGFPALDPLITQILGTNTIRSPPAREDDGRPLGLAWVRGTHPWKAAVCRRNEPAPRTLSG